MPCYAVMGFLSPGDKEPQAFYVGTSAKTAFKYLEDFSPEANLEIKIWENNVVVATIKQKHYLASFSA